MSRMELNKKIDLRKIVFFICCIKNVILLFYIKPFTAEMHILARDLIARCKQIQTITEVDKEIKIYQFTQFANKLMKNIFLRNS